MFDPRKQTPNIHKHILDPVTTINDSNWEPHNFDFHGNIQFRGQKMIDHEDDDESGASSPPLWQNSPPRSPVHPINYRSLSPNSRTQAIARGQWELMEMVKKMPESCFELSLKDLVEQPKSFESQEECLINNINREKNQAVQNRVKIKNEQIRKAKMMRSKSIENGGVFLKMVSPVSFRSKKKEKNSSANTTSVSPKPEECENSSSKNLEKEWWKKRFSGSSSSNSTASTGRNSSRGSSTSSSRNNRSRKREGLLSSCWSSLCLSENNKVMTDALDW
ncbi:uncharacterized protein LOC129901449 [Solanum dulcamara]|uniref:uncharacterized protein LOC129901449 n=1 Tax=Solanum dulcamara TaxID=45834 RepID=UPI002485244D|nr:uncharacterized protein LOC129901449 [Solanum dulcamara]